MKKTKKIQVKEVKAHTKELVIYICDFCEKESKYKMSTCSICERHACSGNIGKYCMRWDEDDWSDYPDKICPICYELKFTKYREESNKIEKEYDERKENLLHKIRKESLAE